MTNALKPIGYGKKILSVEEALKGLEGYNPPESPPVVDGSGDKSKSTNPPGTVAPPHQVPDYFVKPGRFAVGDIKQVGDNYVFHDLELPMGNWKELTLQGNLLPGGRQDFDAWSKVTAASQPCGVMPADIRYGLKTVCYLNNEKTNLKDVIAKINANIWIPDANTSYPHNATCIDYVANGQALVTVGAGWLATHPFGVSYHASIAGPDVLINKQESGKDATLVSALEGLIGEDDPDRAKNVLEWSMNKASAKLLRLNTAKADKRVVFFGVGDGNANVFAVGGGVVVIDRWPARGVNADAKNFHRK